jgi:hypothetical protein
LAAPDLSKTNLDSLLVERGLIPDTPPQVDSLEPGSVLLTQLRQLWKDVALERVSFFLQVLEGRTDENAKGAGCDWHGACSDKR